RKAAASSSSNSSDGVNAWMGQSRFYSAVGNANRSTKPARLETRCSWWLWTWFLVVRKSENGQFLTRGLRSGPSLFGLGPSSRREGHCLGSDEESHSATVHKEQRFLAF